MIEYQRFYEGEKPFQRLSYEKQYRYRVEVSKCNEIRRRRRKKQNLDHYDTFVYETVICDVFGLECAPLTAGMGYSCILNNKWK